MSGPVGGGAAGLILASASPRRREILRTLGIAFEVCPTELEEIPGEGEPAEDFALRMAAEKALAVSRARPEAFVLGADTVVVLDGEIFGKPGDEAEARDMIGRLGGRIHEVMTAIALARGGELLDRRLSVTEVRFAPLSHAQVCAYAATGEGADKAGAYAVQGMASGFVADIFGSYTSVVGLPAMEVIELLRETGALDRWPCLPEGSA